MLGELAIEWALITGMSIRPLALYSIQNNYNKHADNAKRKVHYNPVSPFGAGMLELTYWLSIGM